MSDRAHSIERIYGDNVNRRDALFDELRASGTAEQRRALIGNRVEDWPGELRRAQETLMLASAIVELRAKTEALRRSVALPDPDEERDAILRELVALIEPWENATLHGFEHHVAVPFALLRRARALVQAGKENA